MAQGISGVRAPDDVTGDTFGDYLFGVERQQATAPFIDLPQTTTGFGREGFYGDLEAARQRNALIAGQQQSLADALRARAEGRGGPSLAELQLQQTLEQNQRQAAGALAGVRGMNPALAQRLLLNQQAGLSQQAAGQGAVLRAQEQLSAQQALGQQLATMRGAETGMYGSAGGFGLGQEKLGVETEEARKQRELDIAKANQAAELERQKIQQGANAIYNKGTDPLEGAEGLGKGAGGAMTGYAALGGEEAAAAAPAAAAAVAAAHGGIIKMPKASIIAAHEKAKAALKAGSFKEYGDRAENVAYATMMKQQQKSRKMSAGGELEKLDNKKNDKIPALLSEGEAVIPRSIMASEDPPSKAAAFIKALQEKKSPKAAKKEALDGKLALRHLKDLENRIKALEGKKKK